MRPPLILSIWLCAALLSACSPSEPPARSWHEELTVAVTQDQDSVDAEFRQQLVALFARQLQVKVRLVPLPPDRVVPALMTGRVHFAAVGMRSNAPGSGLRFTPSYQTVSEQAVCLAPPRRMQGLADKTIAVLADSAQEQALRELQQKLPTLHWESRRGGTVAGLLGDVADGRLDCTVANDEQLAMARNFHPQLDAAFDVAAPSQLAWGFAPDGDDALFNAAQDFFTTIRHDGTLRRLLDRYYGHNERLEPIDSAAFLTAARTVLPRFRRMFEEAERLTGIEWQLLAALAYQESHWNPLAASFTNVRGMMMLTGETADRMNVADRLDARASIIAGARYLQMLEEQLPPRIPDGERIWLALAAYNQGTGHLEDARVLAARAGLNPDSWSDVKKTMRWLSQPEYIDQTKHGYARGGEAVVLVETVHLYYDMLKRLDVPDPPAPSPFRLHLPDIMKFGFGQ